MKEILEIINIIANSKITADIVFAFALLIVAFRIDRILKINAEKQEHLNKIICDLLENNKKKQEEFYLLINDILKRQNKIILYFINNKDDNHKGGMFYG